MAGLRNSCDGFAYLINAKEGGYVLISTDAAAILVQNKVTGECEVHLNRCPPICLNLTQKFM